MGKRKLCPHSCISLYLDIEDPFNAPVLLLPGQPTFTQEEEDFLCIFIQHLHLVQVPVSAHHTVIMADLNPENLSKVDGLYSECIHLGRLKVAIDEITAYL